MKSCEQQLRLGNKRPEFVFKVDKIAMFSAIMKCASPNLFLRNLSIPGVHKRIMHT